MLGSPPFTAGTCRSRNTAFVAFLACVLRAWALRAGLGFLPDGPPRVRAPRRAPLARGVPRWAWPDVARASPALAAPGALATSRSAARGAIEAVRRSWPDGDTIEQV